jgi:hypothetical protein
MIELKSSAQLDSKPEYYAITTPSNHTASAALESRGLVRVRLVTPVVSQNTLYLLSSYLRQECQSSTLQSIVLIDEADNSHKGQDFPGE